MRKLRARFDDLDEVREGLQDAIELELSTIPPYLYALWSIKDRQSRAAQLILNVVAEEMLHLALAANVLNAIGGQPRLHPDVAPTYPGSLPAGVDKGLVVGLRRCDAAQLEVFRQIEAPEDPVDIRAFASEASTVVTIGQFYEGLAEAISQLGEGIYTGDPGRQLRRWPTLGEIRPIERGADVRWAISTIKEQGEGASSYDPNDRDGELGHYYLFWEIIRGREIIRTPNGWAFAGAEIPFPATYPVVDNPTVAGLPQKSQQQALARQFNASYANLLRALHRTFDGEPYRLDAALGLMYSLRVLALELFKFPSGRGDGTVAGPSFEVEDKVKHPDR